MFYWRGEDDFSSLAGRGVKLLYSLVVLQWLLLNPLPDRDRMKILL